MAGRPVLRAALVAALAGALVLAGAAGALWRGGLPPAPLPADRMAAPLPAPERPAPALRLAVLGTSLTARASWPEAVAGALAACLGRPVDLIRIARPGATSAWGLAQAGRVVAAAPDVVLVEFAINDADLRDGLRLSEAVATHRALIAALGAARPDMRIVLMTMNPAERLRGLVRPRLAAHYAAYRDLAAGADAGLVDLYPRWRALPRAARGLGADGLHPDDAVARAVIVPVLVPWLGGLAGAECAPPAP